MALTLDDFRYRDNEEFYSFNDLIHPIGFLYLSSTPINPAEKFGGTWVYVEDAHLFQGWYIYIRIADENSDTEPDSGSDEESDLGQS